MTTKNNDLPQFLQEQALRNPELDTTFARSFWDKIVLQYPHTLCEYCDELMHGEICKNTEGKCPYALLIVMFNEIDASRK